MTDDWDSDGHHIEPEAYDVPVNDEVVIEYLDDAGQWQECHIPARAAQAYVEQLRWRNRRVEWIESILAFVGAISLALMLMNLVANLL